MHQFSDNDSFYQGFMYGIRLSHEGLLPTLDQKATSYELSQTVKRLNRSKQNLDLLIDEAIGLLEEAVMQKKMKEEKGESHEH